MVTTVRQVGGTEVVWRKIARDFLMTHANGLHGRPAAVLVRTAGQFESDISMTYRRETVNAKSILGVLSLGIGYCQRVTIMAEGPDAIEAMQAISYLFEISFGVHAEMCLGPAAAAAWQARESRDVPAWAGTGQP